MPDPLLDAKRDPQPVEIIHPHSNAPLLLVCEHAGSVTPAALGRLGLQESEFDTHIAFDIGAENVARRLADAFGCTLILQRYSRLVIDCNRPAGSPQSIPDVSGGITIPGNAELTKMDRKQREDEIFEPFADACRKFIDKPNIRFAFSIHSFTANLLGVARPWHVGLLYRSPKSHGDKLAGLIEKARPDLILGRNEPYKIEDESDWFIPVCAEGKGIPHCLIEIRNDLLGDDAAAQIWASHLHKNLLEFMEEFDDTDP